MTGTEKFKGGARVTFVCGGRALRRAAPAARRRRRARVRALSVLPQELPAAIERLQADSKELRKRAGDLQAALAVHEADRLLALAAPQRGGGDRRDVLEDGTRPV